MELNYEIQSLKNPLWADLIKGQVIHLVSFSNQKYPPPGSNFIHFHFYLGTRPFPMEVIPGERDGYIIAKTSVKLSLEDISRLHVIEKFVIFEDGKYYHLRN